MYKYQSSSFCFSLIRGIVGITSTEAARGIVLDIYSSQTVALCDNMGAGIRGSIVGIARGGAIQEALGIIPSCHMADKILDILPRYST